MKYNRLFTRDISYAGSAKTKGGRALIRTVENLTGRPKLIKKALGYEADVAAGRDFWQVMVERYKINLDFIHGSLDNIPSNGPVIVISNHPFGILDGLVLGYILSKTRGDFRILAHRVFRKARELDNVILPISFDQTKEAVHVNLQTRKTALTYLADGGCIGIFPGGTVSTAPTPMGQAMDPQWRNFTAKLVIRSNAAVVPVYFEGANSRLFQLASHAHYTLRMAMLIREFKKKIKKTVPLVIGETIPKEALQKYYDAPNALMEFLRKTTYSLSPTCVDTTRLGYEFEDTYR